MQYYFLKDIEGNDLSDTEGIKLIKDSIIYCIPGTEENKDYVIYLAWKAEGNTAQTEE